MESIKKEGVNPLLVILPDSLTNHTGLCLQRVVDYVSSNLDMLRCNQQLHHNLKPENVSFLTSCLIPPTT